MGPGHFAAVQLWCILSYGTEQAYSRSAGARQDARDLVVLALCAFVTGLLGW